MNERYMSASRTEKLLKRGLPATLALGGAAVFGIGHVAEAIGDNTPECTPVIEHVTVQPGDTLWTISNEYVPGVDTRDTIHTIAQNNPDAIDAAGKIHPGDTLSVEVCLPDPKTE